MKLFIIGQPSNYGGADTELADQIKVWKLLGLDIHIVPTVSDYVNNDPDIVVHEKNNWEAIDGNVCISFCNTDFLKNIKDIKKYSSKTIWVNCMTDSFMLELNAHQNKYIDLFLYQSEHQRKNIFKLLSSWGRPNYKMIVPYFDSTGFDYYPNKESDEFMFGRISRNAFNKFGKFQFDIYNEMDIPSKHGVVVGIDQKLINKLRVKSGDHINYKLDLYKPNEIDRYEFQSRISVLCMTTQTMENLPRVGFESVYSGNVLVVDDKDAWRAFVDDGESGLLCKTKQDFIEAMEYIANNPDARISMCEKAYTKVLNDFSVSKSIDSWKDVFFTQCSL